MSDIFISYSSSDRSRIQPLVQLLKEEGWSVWWDRTIPIGKRYDEVIENALNSAKCVIVVWSKTSVTSEWVKTEAAEGVQRNALAPVLLDNVKVPLEFKRIQAAQLFDWNGERTHPEVIQFLDSVLAILGNPPGQSQGNQAVQPSRHREDSADPQLRVPERKRRSSSANLMLIAGALVAAIALTFFIWKLTRPTTSVRTPDQPNSNAVVNKNATVRVIFLNRSAEAQAIVRALKEQGYANSTSIQRQATDTHPEKPEVRYYYSEDADYASKVREIVSKTVDIQREPNARTDQQAQKNHSKGDIQVYLD